MVKVYGWTKQAKGATQSSCLKKPELYSSACEFNSSPFRVKTINKWIKIKRNLVHFTNRKRVVVFNSESFRSEFEVVSHLSLLTEWTLMGCESELRCLVKLLLAADFYLQNFSLTKGLISLNNVSSTLFWEGNICMMETRLLLFRIN